jgi:hypothetical protein
LRMQLLKLISFFQELRGFFKLTLPDPSLIPLPIKAQVVSLIVIILFYPPTTLFLVLCY